MRYRLKLDRLTALLAASRVSQNHWSIRLGLSRGHWLVRGRGSDEQLVRAVRETAAGIDPAVPPEIELLRTAADRVTSPRRVPMQVIGAFGVLALVLASIGIYGVLSFAVARRTRELAVRAALGADRGNLLALVLGSGAPVIAAGVLVGVIGALLPHTTRCAQRGVVRYALPRDAYLPPTSPIAPILVRDAHDRSQEHSRLRLGGIS